ncbi:Magnesium and cobalt efflux protein CorC [Symmachiella dynata]|uniref:Magnesium and cobalt efflux protein CorC n=1 Tax=Symmachiella dynata TaxID=2527995 RepID=A0A517ZR21_9PLAN|nr:hemolysin family protein [Symmachiella dynata]QDU44939.1 Magnesium and cobalt efflux protein CorC [Symmachiella dynata]
MIPLLFTGISIALLFFSALAAYSFSDFSRRRLEEICRRRGLNDRFGMILRHYEQAVLGWQLVSLLSFVAALISGARSCGFSLSDTGDWTLADVGSAVLLGGTLFFSAVIFPWAISRVAGESFICFTWSMTRGLLLLFKPVIWLTGWVDTIVHRLAGRQEPENGDATNITEEILTVVDEGQREGVLELEAGTMIHRVMELQEADVADIMVPRTDMTCIHVESPLQAAREKLLEAGHSRVPIIGESPDDIIGVLYAKDLLNFLNSDGNSTAELRDIVRQPFYVPESTGIDTLLQMMKTQRVHLAIVLDEYGGVAGLATMEDILEEIVGEIVDEFDSAETEPFRQISEAVTEVDARVHVDDVNERLKLALPDDRDYDTIGGFAFSVLGHIPTAGESFAWEQAQFTILEADKRKIVRLQIEIEPSVAAEADAG